MKIVVETYTPISASTQNYWKNIIKKRKINWSRNVELSKMENAFTDFYKNTNKNLVKAYFFNFHKSI